jgi:predicted nucleic acid-binding Zn ribbon protein
MPTYIYSDGEHQQEVFHGMTEDIVVNCIICKKIMHRRPQAPNVNWNGLPPHLADSRPPVIQNFIDTAPERRAKYLDTERKK